jgi:hypothetical protein
MLYHHTIINAVKYFYKGRQNPNENEGLETLFLNNEMLV